MMQYRGYKTVYTIAEIGVNHDGSVEKAINLIDLAIDAGANAVKFQSFAAEDLATKETPKVSYQISNTEKSISHYEMLKRLELTEFDEQKVFEYCKVRGINFISTPYSVRAAERLDRLGVSEFKVASADIIDIPLLKAIALTKKPVILSVGMASLGEIEAALSVFALYDPTNLVLLHCVSNYPCSDNSLNLNVIKRLAKTFNYPVGFSDHSIGYLAAVMSIGLGGSVIEKHFTSNNRLPGPDHSASSNPIEFKQLIENIRRAEVQLGSGEKKLQDEEVSMIQNSRKSLVYANDISAGKTFSSSDFTMKRPGTGLTWNHLKFFIGRKSRKELKADTICDFGHID